MPPRLVPKGPSWWVGGEAGKLAPWAQAQAWALTRLPEPMQDGDIAQKVLKVGGGHPSKQDPRTRGEEAGAAGGRAVRAEPAAAAAGGLSAE